MEKVRISRERVFAELRINELTNLAQVQRMYMEANGSFTLIKSEKGKSGLSVLPEWDKEFTNEQKKDNNKTICGYCGFEKQHANGPECPNCKKTIWTTASY